MDGPWNVLKACQSRCLRGFCCGLDVTSVVSLPAWRNNSAAGKTFMPGCRSRRTSQFQACPVENVQLLLIPGFDVPVTH